jgi:hypothetical protein
MSHVKVRKMKVIIPEENEAVKVRGVACRWEHWLTIVTRNQEVNQRGNNLSLTFFKHFIYIYQRNEPPNYKIKHLILLKWAIKFYLYST